MSAELESLQVARQKIQELLEAAKTGAIIPFRLPGQIEEIAQLLAKVEQEHKAAQEEAAAKAAPADMATYLQEEAYFVGHAVHELRTPMTSIRGYSDMLGAMGTLNDMQKQFLDVIKTNSRRMESLLADVSHINKIRKGTLKLQAKMDTFKNIAMRIEKDLSKRAEDLNRKLELEIPQGLPLLTLDGEMLTLALVKLVENGLQYSPAETGKVTLSAEGADNQIVIRIADNGIGMTSEEVSKLGTLYFRSDHDAVREYKGSGLGIPIAYGIIHMLGGSISVQSAPDAGTTFTVTIPAGAM
jgi:two-component system sensor histidine kinase VicK